MKALQIGDLLVPVPIIQGGMGIGISLSGLAAAVANMGGVGVIASVGIGLIHGSPENNYRKNNIDGLRREIRTARKNSKGILGVNIMTVLTNYADLVATSIEEKIDIIFSGAGLPLDLPKYLNKKSRTKLVPIVSSARAASIIINKWRQNFNYYPDAIVVEGPKAGGHLGFKASDLNKSDHSLENIVGEVAELCTDIEKTDNKKIPIIAAGGIQSGKDIHELIALGASGVQIGSKFIATSECDASIQFKEAIVNSVSEGIKVIESPVGLPGRALFNNFLERAGNGEKRPKSCKYNCIKSCNPKTTNYCIAEALLAAYKGDFTSGFAFSGSNAFQIKSLSTVPDVFRELLKEFEEVNVIRE